MVFSEGWVRASGIYFNAENNGGPSGTYTIFPKDHIEPYFEFVANQYRKMVA